MKNKLIIAGMALLALAAPVRPQAGEFKLQHHSSFDSQPAHNPFWPIGWVKSDKPQEAPQEAVATISPDNFVVTSISLSATPLAVINGKTFGEGEFINAVFGGQRVRIQVASIGDGVVTLLYAGKKIQVPMKRALSAPKQEVKENTPQDNAMILH